MEADQILPLIVRWVHIGSAIAAIGAPFFIRFALLPSAKEVLDDATHQKLREAVNRRWRKIVYILITLFILTGFYTFFVVAPWKQMPAADKKLYHMLFGIKVLAAFVIFFLASALAGRTAGLAPIRKQAKMWLGVVLLLAAVIVACAGIMRSLHDAVPITIHIP
jgi:uncharacterized membrane protein